jgi:predicted nuclease of predicted toxin-antitoxin system
MANLLANENVPAAVIVALRANGHDVASMHETGPGTPDDQVLALALTEGRNLLTFDKDFGEMAFRQGLMATPGVILLRPRLRSPDYLVRFTLAVLAQGLAWQGHFAVAEEGRLRLVPLPA